VPPEQLSLFEAVLPAGGPEPASGPGADAGREELLLRLEPHLRDHGVAIGRLVLTDNRSILLSSRRAAEGRQDVRLHWSFAAAPEAVLAAVARVLGGPRRGEALRRARAMVRLWVAEHRRDSGRGRPPGEVAAMTATRRPAGGSPAPGRVHDLAAIRDEVNGRYFGGGLRVAIAWARPGRPQRGRRRRRTILKLGSWSPEDRTVRIHPVLDHESVPRVVVASIVHHELLHAELEPEVRNGRRRLHTPEFRRRERSFEGHAEAERWIGRNLDELVRRRARSSSRGAG
jgi:hypothetical protein